MQIERKIVQDNVTVVANSAGLDVEIESRSGVFILNVFSVSGTSPTLDVTVQEKDFLSGQHFDVVTFAQKVAVGDERIALTPIYGGNFRVAYTVGGSSPSFTFSVSFQGKEGDES